MARDFSRFEPVDQEESSSLGKGLRYAGQLASEAVKAPFKLAEIPADIVRSVLPDTTKRLPEHMQRGLPRVSEGIQQATDLVGGKYKQISKPGSNAENFEKAGLYSAQALPFILSGGTSGLGTGAKLGADYLGSLARTYTEDWTGSPFVGALTDLLVQHKLDKGATALKDILTKTNKFKNAEKGISSINSPVIDKHISKIYKKSDEIGKATNSSPAIRDYIKEGLSKVQKEVNSVSEFPSDVFSRSAAKDTLKGISNAQDFALRQKLSLFDIAKKERDLNKHINALQKKNPQGSIGIDYLRDVKNVFTGALNKASEEFPEFGKYYQNSKNLYQTDKWMSNLGDWAQKASEKGLWEKIMPNKIAQSVISGLLGYGAGIPGAIAGGVGYPIAKAAVVKGAANANKIGQGAQFSYYLSQTPEGLNVLKDIVINAAKNNIPLLVKDLKKLNNLADKFEPKDLNRFEPV